MHTGDALLKEAEALLYREADCLDRADLPAWMALYTEDGTYWMPAVPHQEDPLNHISHFYDDRVMMEIRARNFVHPRAPSKDHPVRCSHLIGNIRLTATDAAASTCTVVSNFHAMLFYREEKRIYGGRYEHILRHTDTGLLIVRKRVDLIDCDAAHKSLVIYL